MLYKPGKIRSVCQIIQNINMTVTQGKKIVYFISWALFSTLPRFTFPFPYFLLPPKPFLLSFEIPRHKKACLVTICPGGKYILHCTATHKEGKKALYIGTVGAWCLRERGNMVRVLTGSYSYLHTDEEEDFCALVSRPTYSFRAFATTMPLLL